MEEIYFDHNNEHLHDEFSPGQLDYRKKEIRIKGVYDKFLYLYPVVYGGILITTYLLDNYYVTLC